LERLKNDTLRVGIIGAGRIVERVHLPLLDNMAGVRLAGLFDPDLKRAMEVAENRRILKVCQSLDELLSLNPDAVLIASPNYLHAEMSIAALEARSHVLCEKPMATNVIDAERMIEAARRAGRELMVACTNRFRPEVIALHRIIREGQLGRIKSIRCGWLRRNGIPGVGTWFTHRRQSGGGVLTDLGTHLIDLAIWLGELRQLLKVDCVFKRTAHAQAQAEWYLPGSASVKTDCDVEISASGSALFDGPVELSIEVSWASDVPEDKTFLHFGGTRGTALLDTLFGLSPGGRRPRHPLRICLDGRLLSSGVTSAADVLQPYKAQWEFFLESIRRGRSLASELSVNLATVQLIEAMYRTEIEGCR
jgi:predicted dehydrogenase